MFILQAHAKIQVGLKMNRLLFEMPPNPGLTSWLGRIHVNIRVSAMYMGAVSCSIVAPLLMLTTT
jgi:hypothetical protein